MKERASDEEGEPRRWRFQVPTLRLWVSPRELLLMTGAALMTYVAVPSFSPQLWLAAARVSMLMDSRDLAERLYEGLARSRPDADEARSLGLRELAGLRRAQGRHAEAALYLERARDLVERRVGRYHPEVADLLDEEALVAMERDDLASALGFQGRALIIRVLAYGWRDARTGLALEHVADLKLRNGELGDAMRFARWSLAIGEEALGSEHPHVVRSVGRIGAIYRAEGHATRAELYLRRALDTQDGMLERSAQRPQAVDRGAVLSTAHRYERATVLRELGALKVAQGEFRKARGMFARSFKLRESGPDASLHRAEIFLEVARSYEAEGRYQTALAHLRVASRFASDPPRRPWLRAQLHERIAERYAAMRQTQLARAHAGMAREIRRRTGASVASERNALGRPPMDAPLVAGGPPAG